MPDDAQAVLARRAETLARPTEGDADQPTVALLVLTVAGGRRYGVETKYVGRVTAMNGLSRLPATCGHLLGVVSIGGDIVPVADLASLLGVDAVNPNRPFAVAVQRDTDVFGLLVDGAHDVVTVPEQQLAPVPDKGDGAPSLVRAVTTDGMLVLDLPSFFADTRLTVPARHHHAPFPTMPAHRAQE